MVFNELNLSWAESGRAEGLRGQHILVILRYGEIYSPHSLYGIDIALPREPYCLAIPFMANLSYKGII